MDLTLIANNSTAFAAAIHIGASIEGVVQNGTNPNDAERGPCQWTLPTAFAPRKQESIIMEILGDSAHMSTQAKAFKKQPDGALNLFIWVQSNTDMRNEDQSHRQTQVQLSPLGFAKLVFSQTLPH
jgi:hypothetical protein